MNNAQRARLASIPDWMKRHHRWQTAIFAQAQREDRQTVVLFCQLLRDVAAQIEEELIETRTVSGAA